MNMWFPKFAMFSWSLCALTLDCLDAFSCPKGQRVLDVRGKKSCAPCHSGYFQPEANESQVCRPCRRCSGPGYNIVEKCTSLRDTQCECTSGFTLEFEDCVKVKEKTRATATTSIQVPRLTAPTSPRPQERAPTQNPAHNVTTTTPSTTTTTGHFGFTATTQEKTRDSHVASVAVGLVCLMVGLLVLTALLCKPNLVSRIKRKSEQTRISSFRTPVEESVSLDSLKQSQEEP